MTDLRIHIHLTPLPSAELKLRLDDLMVGKNVKHLKVTVLKYFIRFTPFKQLSPPSI